MSVRTFLANVGLIADSFNGYRRWRRSTQCVEEAQRDVLLSILKRNTRTEFGKTHRFGEIVSPRDFQQRVPLGTYADFAPYIRRMGAGEQNVLVAGSVSRFELSSGSTSASKLIPYTPSLKSEFQQGLNPWLYSLYTSHPGLLIGKQYWSVTPVGQKQSRTSGGIPIGFEEDSEYFGFLKRKLIRNLMAVPSAVSQISDIETFRYVTLRFLLQCRDLTFISVWNPTFLMLLLNAAASRMDDLTCDITNGTLTAGLDPNVRSRLGKLRADPNRAAEIQAVWRTSRSHARWQAIWPKLVLLSCWADASASRYATELQEYFPKVAMQPKGLLATEGCITFPIGSERSSALSVNSHFFEFAEIADSGKTGSIKLARELALGHRYSVIITTGGGLYRYQLDDIVEVAGFVGDRCPTLRFIGKAESVVDLVGEKLNECHVRKLLNEELKRFGIHATFCMVAPEASNGSSAHYTLFIQCRHANDDGVMKELGMRLETGLWQNYHYQYCRYLGQLAPLRIYVIPSESCDAAELYIKTCTLLGQRLGNIKPTALHAYREWRNVFPGKYL